MIKTINELKTLLEGSQKQVFINHTTQKDNVHLPYIIILDDGTRNVLADNQVYEEINDYIVIAYCLDPYTKDVEFIKNIKNIFTTNHIPYEINSIDWQDQLLLYRVAFTISL